MPLLHTAAALDFHAPAQLLPGVIIQFLIRRAAVNPFFFQKRIVGFPLLATGQQAEKYRQHEKPNGSRIHEQSHPFQVWHGKTIAGEISTSAVRQ